MVIRAEEGKVIQIRGSTIGPVRNVVQVQKPPTLATRELADSLVPHPHRPLQRCTGAALAAPQVKLAAFVLVSASLLILLATMPLVTGMVAWARIAHLEDRGVAGQPPARFS